jgi:hypothetical protein
MLKPVLCVVVLMLTSTLLCLVIQSVSPAPVCGTTENRRRCDGCQLLQHTDPVLGMWHCHRCGKVNLPSEAPVDDPEMAQKFTD